MNQQNDGRIRVKRWGIGLLAAVAVGGGIFFSTTPPANAQPIADTHIPTTDTVHMAMEADHYEDLHDPMTQVAELFGIDEEALYAELDAGKSLAEIAKAKDVDPQTVIDLLVAEEEAWIDELLAEGEISAEEAAKWKTESTVEIAFDVNTVYIDPFILATQTIGIDEETLWDELDAGKTIAEVATANGVDPQKVIDAVLASENAYIDQAVAAGLVSGEEAEEWRAEINEYLSQAINDTFDFYEEEALEYFEDFEDVMSPVVAELFGLDEEALYTELDAGKSLAEIATANDVDPQQVIDLLVAKEEAWIDELVDKGEMSADEAAIWKTELAAEIAFDVNTAYIDPFILAAQTIGIDEETLWDELDAGKTVAEVATANGVAPQVVIDAVVASENEYIDKAVAAGLVSNEEAQEWRSEVVEYVTEMANESWDFDDVFEADEEHEAYGDSDEFDSEFEDDDS